MSQIFTNVMKKPSKMVMVTIIFNFMILIVVVVEVYAGRGGGWALGFESDREM